MFKSHNDFSTEIRAAVRGGNGNVIQSHIWKKDDAELKKNVRLFAEMTLEPGCSIGYHKHENEDEIFVILEGRAEVDDNGKIIEAGPGDSTLTRSGEGHSIKALDSKLRFLAVIVTY